ncbi:hypothetical protein PB2503_08619 [Parvularcula bermudensis HTCC2503]|uniref:Type II secretion system protein L n=1 Tax=Parvularcula bermudensis (strain ATCC BAA-594 / HTCC2503 / KCTC 12087) TaxID=314260 RepID=E0TBQ8_PARBH|nr:type II secretion system protein GspL [Parvularcula bermudensis]ADM09779.1 hypothetical protein PB2503_08619 [Parvularcula bermudensis HTCC2503]
MTKAIILLPSAPEGGGLWAIGDREGVTQSGDWQGGDALPIELVVADDLTVILPGLKVATRRLALPVTGDKALESAARLAFEDILAEPVDRFHFAFGVTGHDGRRTVSAIPIDLIEGSLAYLRELELGPTAITVDHLAIAGEDARDHLLFSETATVAYLSDGAFTVPAEMGADLLALMPLAANADVTAAGGHPPKGGGADRSLPDRDALAAYWFGKVMAHRPPNALRGRFRRRTDWRGVGKRVRMPVALSLGVIALWLGGVAIEGMKYQRVADQLYDEAAARFSEAFPATPIRDLSRQASRLGGGATTDRFLPLSSRLAAALESHDEVQLEGLRYGQDGELVADLRFPNTAALEQVREDLRTGGITAREGETIRREADGSSVGQLFVGGAQ